MSSEPSRISQIARRVGKIALKIALVLCALILVLGLFTQTSTFKDILREQILEATNSSLQGHLEMGEIEGNLFTGFSTGEVRIYDVDGRLAVAVEHVEAGYSLLPLLQRKLAISELIIERPTGIMRYDEQGELNLLRIANTEENVEKQKGAAFSILVEKIDVKQGRLLYINEPTFAPGSPELNKTSLGELDTLLDSPQELTSDSLDERFRELLRDTPDLSHNAVPSLAMVSGLAVAARFEIDTEATIMVDVEPITTILDANTWTAPLSMQSEDIELVYGDKQVTLKTGRIDLGGDTSGIDPTELEVELIPITAENQTPYPAKFELDLGRVTATRALLAQTISTFPLQDGFQISAFAQGDPAAIKARAEIQTIEAPTKINLDARLDAVLSSLLQDLDLPPSAPEPPEVTPTYDAKVELSRVDPSALMTDLPETDVNATLAIQGKGLDPTGDLMASIELMMSPSSAMGWEVESAHIKADYADKALTISKGEVLTPYADATLTGNAAWPGVIDMQMSARAGERHARSVTIPDVGKLEQDNLEIAAKVSARMDLEAKDIVQSISSARVDADWDIAGFEQPGTIALGASKGELMVDLSSVQAPEKRAVELRLNATARGLDTPDVAVRSADIAASSRVITPWLPEDPMALRSALLANLDIKLSGARAAGASIGKLDAKVALSPGDAGRLDYTLTVNTLRDLSYPASDIKIGALDTRMEGEVGLSDDAQLTYMAAQGSGSVLALDAAGQRVNKADFSVDVAGRPPLLRGDIKLDAMGIQAGGVELENADVVANVAPSGDFSVTAQVKTAPVKPIEGGDEQPSQRLKVAATGNLSDSLDRVSNLQADIYNLDQDANTPIWSIEDASVSTRGGEVKVDGLSLVNGDQSIKIDGVYRTSGQQDLSVTAKNVKVGELREDLGLAGLLPDVTGDVETVDFRLSGTAKEPEIFIDIIFKNFFNGFIGPLDLVLKARYQNDKLTVNTLELDALGMQMIRAQARIPISLDLAGNVDVFWQENVLVTFFVEPINLAIMSTQMERLKKYNLGGKISGGGILNGTLRHPVLDVNMNAEDFDFDGEVAGQKLVIDGLSMTNRFEYEPPEGQQGGFALDSKLKRGDRVIASIDASSPIPLADWLYEIVEMGGEVDFATEVASQQFSLLARFDELELQELSEMGLTEELELGGTFDMTARGEGTFEQPKLDIEALLDKLDIKGPMAGQRVDFEDINFSSKFTLDGKRGSLDPVTLVADMNWHDHKVMDLAAAMQIPLNGWLTRTTRGETIDFATELQTIPFDVDLVIDRFNLSHVAIAPLLKESDAAGVITSRLDAQGTLRDPTGTFSLDVGEMVCESDPTKKKPCNGFGWDRYRDIVISTKLDLKDKLVTLQDFLINWDDLDIARASGSLPLPMDTLLDGAPLEDIDYDFTLSMFPVPLNKLSAVDYTFASLTGAMKAKMHLTGSLRKPEAQGCFALLDAKLGENRSSVGSIGLDIDSRDQAVIGALKICQSDGTTAKANNYATICTLDTEQLPTCKKGSELAYANTAARLNTDLIALSNGADVLAPSPSSRKPQGPLGVNDDIFVSVHTRDGKPIKLEEVLPMNILRAFAREIKGTLAVDVDIKGSYDAPVPTGKLDLSEGSITLPSLGRRFDEIAVKADMDPTSIELEKFRVAEGDSDIVMTGKLNHEKLSPKGVTAKLVADDFNVGDFVDFPFFASGQMTLDGRLDTEPMDLTVNVNKLDIQLTEDIGSDLHPTELDSDIVVLKRNQDGSLMIDGELPNAGAEIGRSSDDIMGGLAIKTRVKMSRDCWVHHPYGEVNLTGDFTALLDGPSLTMSGDIQAIRGQAEFLGKIFRVERALITFTGADPPDPRLQIEAAYELDQSIVAAVGPASDGRPRIMVVISGTANDPVLKLRSDPPMSETDIIYVLATNRPPGTAGVGQDSSVAAAALSAASGLLVGMLKDELSDNLPLDFFDVLNVDTSNFEVGKYVYNGKIYLSYRYLFGNISGNSSIYQFDYHFFPRWTLEAQGSSGDNGGELNLNVFWDAF